MKGLFFYRSDLQLSGLPDEISPEHERGWWTTSRDPLILERSPDSRYLRLNQLQWLGRYRGVVPKEDLLTKTQLEDYVRNFFEGEITPSGLRRRELTYAEVEIVNNDFNERAESQSAEFEVREISRGHFVHESWPDLARWAAEQNFDQLETSKKVNSKRPPA